MLKVYGSIMAVFLFLIVLLVPTVNASTSSYTYDLDVDMEIDGHFYDDTVPITVTVASTVPNENCDYCDMGLKYKFYYSENGEDWIMVDMIDKMCDISSPVELEYDWDTSDIDKGEYYFKVVVSVDTHRGEDTEMVTVGHNSLNPKWFALGLMIFVLLVLGMVRKFSDHSEFP